jgi:cytoskeleton protein RodZ
MDPGGHLRRARERRLLTLADVAERTNIPLRLLAAIERNALDEIPGGLITRGYLRAYAVEVGLDAEALVAEAAAATAQPDVIDLLRARFRIAEPREHQIVRLLLVVACITGFLYVMLMHQSQQSASTAAAQEPQSFQLRDSPLSDGSREVRI